ncbi:hypothetical protein VBD025_08625 [Virgibacillus flavescens]|uniref:hypothetical protein n=1 Tax=Virgibacillus flavescens TaxID=1611422 RepID=UPI003D34C075
MDKKYKENAAEKAGRNVYFSPFTPCLMGLIACAIPFWSPLYAKILAVIISLLVLRVLLGYFKQKHRDYSWHALTGVITYNLVGIFCIIPFWKVLGEATWLSILLICLYVI